MLYSGRQRVKSAMTYLVMVAICLVVAFPFYWMIVGSFMSEAEITSYPLKLLPSELRTDNYSVFFRFGQMSRDELRETLRFTFGGVEGKAGIFTWIGNTLYITVLGWIGVILVSSAAAYAFAKIDFPGRDTLLIVYMSGMFIPWMASLIPKYLLYKSVGWENTFLPLYFQFLVGGGVMVVFLFRQHFKTIPTEMIDAAEVDGAGHVQVFFRLMLPLSKAPIAAVTVLFVMERWNELLMPLIYLGGIAEKWTLSLAMFNIVRAEPGAGAETGATPINRQMAGAVILVLPVIALFFLTQRYFVQGLTQGSINK